MNLSRNISVIILIGSIVFCNLIYAKPSYHHPEQFLKSLEGKDEKTIGKAVYQQFCSTCHAKNPSIPLGAPRIKEQMDWAERQHLRSLDDMLKKITEGFNAMPPRGGCFECTDKQLLAAIKYLLPNTSRK